MHLFALDSQNKVIQASEALKQKDYFCLECQTLVRRRGGFFKQTHFYHLSPNRTCRQSGKSLEHLQLQNHMQSIFPNCQLEKPFKKVNRIADVVLEDHKIIFEIQCSPIEAKEVEQRNRDYQSMGYQVVWILHDMTYNKKRLTAAEYFLQDSPHYFSDMNEDGKGRIYDQWDVIKKGQRQVVLGVKEVQMTLFNHFERNRLDFSEYEWIKKRSQDWGLSFSGDFLDYTMHLTSDEQKEFFKEMQVKEEAVLKEFSSEKLAEGLLKKVLRISFAPYRATVNFLLEKILKT
jgi:competence protein CoiA